jgi:hypothetical protein
MVDFLLTEDGSKLLLESGGKLLLESESPPVFSKILIDSVDKSNTYRPESVRIDNVITNRMDVCTFTLEGEHTLTEMESEVILCSSDELTRYFAGILAAVDRDVEGKTKIINCTVQDYTILLDTVIVNTVMENVTDKGIIQALFAAYLPEIDTSEYVADGLLHERIVFNRVTLRQAMQQLSDMSGLDWDVDYWKKLHYFTDSDNPAPFGISDSPDYVATFPCYGLTYNRSGAGLANSYTVIGGNYYSDDTDFELAGNGQTTELLMPYQLHEPVGETAILVYKNTGTDITPVWTLITVGADYLDSLDDFDCLYNYQQKLLKFAVAPANLTRAVKITGRYDVPVRVRVRSQASYDTYGRWFEAVITDTDLKSREEAKLAGKGGLAENAFVKESGTFICDYAGLAAGQLITIVNTDRGINSSYMINNVSMTIIGGTNCRYEVNYGQYNPDLVDIILSLRNSTGQHVDQTDGEVVDEIVVQEETLDLAEATARHEDDFSGGIVNRWLATLVHNVEHERLEMAEDTAVSSHDTEDYHWDAANTRWDFFTWA